jgi:hypothetical protein
MSHLSVVTGHEKHLRAVWVERLANLLVIINIITCNTAIFEMKSVIFYLRFRSTDAR